MFKWEQFCFAGNMASVKEKSDPSSTSAEMMASEAAEAVLEDEESMDVAGENGDVHENGDADGDEEGAKDKKDGKKSELDMLYVRILHLQQCWKLNF